MKIFFIGFQFHSSSVAPCIKSSLSGSVCFSFWFPFCPRTHPTPFFACPPEKFRKKDAKTNVKTVSRLFLPSPLSSLLPFVALQIHIFELSVSCGASLSNFISDGRKDTITGSLHPKKKSCDVTEKN